MELSFNIPLVNQRVIQERRLRPTSFISIFRFGGRRKGFRREGEGRNRYVDRLSLRTVVLTFIIFTLSALDAILTLLHIENGAFELNPLMEQIIQNGFEFFFTIKSLGIGLIAWFLAIHQNYKISSYGMHILAAIYIVFSAHHLACYYLLQ
jgi:hypothetical protein